MTDLVPHQTRVGIDVEAGYRSLREQGLPDPFPTIADDFDASPPEDFLLKPLSER